MTSQHACSTRTRRGQHPLQALLVSFLIGLTTTTPAIADDTEVFFGQVDESVNVYPNVLFALDTSGSMNWKDDGEEGTRLERMKTALGLILDSTANVNIGMMRFNGKNGGGSVLYPVTPIERQMCALDQCGTVNLVYRVNHDADDAEEKEGDVDLTSNDLDIGVSGGDPQIVGLRFRDLNIPQGVTITSAKLEFTADDNESGSANFRIRAEDIDDAPAFSESHDNISDRTVTSAQASWFPPNWKGDNTYQADDIISVVQEVINRPGWCGGNSLVLRVTGTGERDAKSHDQSANEAPVLKLSYDSATIPAGGGCISKTLVSQVGASEDDAEEYLIDGAMLVSGISLDVPEQGGNEQIVGMRFRSLQIPQGATIDSAYLELVTLDVHDDDKAKVYVYAQGADDPEAFSNTGRDLTNRRPGRTDASKWNIPRSDDEQRVTSPNLKTSISQIVNRPGWAPGNDLVLMMERESGGGNRSYYTFDNNPSKAAKLRVTYQVQGGGAGGGGTSYITAREDLKQLVNGLTATGGTPVVDAFYEGAQYLLGGPVDYGKTRGIGNNRNRFHRTSSETTWTGGTVVRDSGCQEGDLDNPDCRNEYLTGNPIYKGSLDSSCQTNHVVFLSDGEATSNSARDKVKSLTGVSTCAVKGNDDDECGEELAHWLYQTDHNTVLSGKQNVTTHTIGFNFANDPDDLLPSLASAGGGDYYNASSADELAGVFNEILGNVLSVDTSFVAPAATVNQFNRLTHRSDVYFSLFKPFDRPQWPGNLKRYSIGEHNNKTVVLDKNGNPAVDPDSGFFAPTSKSWWSDVVDGPAVELGGAAAELSLDDHIFTGDRRVYTFTGDSSSVAAGSAVSLDADAHELSETNTNISLEMLGVEGYGNNEAERTAYASDLLKWGRGVDINDADEDHEFNDIRAIMGDPLHAQPVMLIYANGSAPHTTIFVSTNEGFLHAIDSVEGKELYAFMPQELLPNLRKYFENKASAKHPYGLDGGMAVWTNDENNNVMVDSGEEAYLYFGMRRGGRNYYALDVSNRATPKLKWVIKGGSTGFEELGQSWSKPIPTRIMYNGAPRDVLLFAGGYDTNQDPTPKSTDPSRTVDTVGRAVYVVDARTGALIWSLQKSGGSQNMTDMDYSIPSNMRVLDVDFDGFADQVYVADTGGQLWRFDFVPYHSSGDLFTGGVMAELSGTGNEHTRRFYHEPDVALIGTRGHSFLSINVGSGWQAHPLNTVVTDRFYSLRTSDIYSAPEHYGIENSGSWRPLTEADLTDVTGTLSPGNVTHGWYMNMPATGEKVLSSAITVNNQVIFTSYSPQSAIDACSTAIGTGNIYSVNVLNGSPTGDRDGDGDIDLDDREKLLSHAGIPPAPAALVTDKGIQILVGPEQPLTPKNVNLTERTFWRDMGAGGDATTTATTPAAGE